uniref:Microcephalin n=1 Tax=Bactrocera latifrons TaxID=174628 RepID=A0A0K8V0H1_BACLA
MCTKLFIINGELSDYVSSPDAMPQREKLLISQSPPETFNEVIYGDIENNPVEIAVGSPISNIEHITKTQITRNNTKETSKQITFSKNPQMARIHRDLNSPSASLRVRAIRALKNPVNHGYTNFDIPHEEQNIISLEEYHPSPPPSIEELMRDIIVYVEVRTGEDNRSEGVKKVISQLGARVNDKLLRDTTHVIFKDGLLSTYKKAKNWNIPVVSILWVEACKKKRMICDPNEFPISNIDRYENPELYEKMKHLTTLLYSLDQVTKV